MSQPSAYPPAASFRPASGWQFDGAPAPVASSTSGGGRLVPGIVLVVAFLLIGSQGAASTASVGLPSAAELVVTVALWSTSGVVLATLFAVASRVVGLAIVAGALALADAILIVVLLAIGSLGGWDAVQLVPMLLAVAAAVLAAVDRDRRGRIALTIAAAAVALFYVSAAVVQVLRAGDVGDLGTTLLRSIPIAVLAIAAAFAFDASSSRLVPAILLWALAVSLFGAPLLAAIAGTPPVLASFLVLVVRAVLVAVAGLLVLLAARR